MHTEVPVCKRCCFCLPLRHGLITWGYVRLALGILFFIAISTALHAMLEGLTLQRESQVFIVYIVILAIILLVTLTDIVLNTIFIVGGHKKNLKLLKAYYIYSMALWSLTTLLSFAATIYLLLLFNLGDIDLTFHIYVTMSDICVCLGHIAIQAYFLLLVRSEIIKLRSKCHFRFVNNAAESECVMKCVETDVGETKGTDQKAISLCIPDDTRHA